MADEAAWEWERQQALQEEEWERQHAEEMELLAEMGGQPSLSPGWSFHAVSRDIIRVLPSRFCPCSSQRLAAWYPSVTLAPFVTVFPALSYSLSSCCPSLSVKYLTRRWYHHGPACPHLLPVCRGWAAFQASTVQPTATRRRIRLHSHGNSCAPGGVYLIQRFIFRRRQLLAHGTAR